MWRSLLVGIFTLAFRLYGQDGTITHPPAASDDSIRVEVLEGDGAINNVRLRRGHDAIVKVTGSSGEPVSGVTVTFRVPVSGPSAVFPDGALTLTVESDSHGVAAARGLRPNSLPGPFQIRVNASLHGSTAESVVRQTNADAVVQSGHGKLVVVLLAVGGAAAAGAVLALHGKSAGGSSTALSGGGSISSGVPTFGPPH